MLFPWSTTRHMLSGEAAPRNADEYVTVPVIPAAVGVQIAREPKRTGA